MNSSEIKVSILSITYNHEKYISQAIESFLKQKTNFKFEIVIADDASTDNNQSIIKDYHQKYPEIINPILREQNVGMNYNFSDAIKKCKGKYIALCEGDDYWTDPIKLQKQVDFLEANPEYGMVSTDINLIDEKGDLMADNSTVIRQRKLRKEIVGFYDLLQVNYINTLTVCVRSNIMQKLIMNAKKHENSFIIDYWFWLNISLDYKIRVIDTKTASYRIHPHGVSSSVEYIKYSVFNARADVILQLLKRNRTVNLLRKPLLKAIYNLLINKRVSKRLKLKLLFGLLFSLLRFKTIKDAHI